MWEVTPPEYSKWATGGPKSAGSSSTARLPPERTEKLLANATSKPLRSVTSPVSATSKSGPTAIDRQAAKSLLAVTDSWLSSRSTSAPQGPSRVSVSVALLAHGVGSRAAAEGTTLAVLTRSPKAGSGVAVTSKVTESPPAIETLTPPASSAAEPEAGQAVPTPGPGVHVQETLARSIRSGSNV